MGRYPGEYLRYRATLNNIATEERMKELTAEANQGVPLKQKNVYIYGDPGTGKSWLAREACGPRAYLKAQNKWFDGLREETTGLVWNDLQDMKGFNWQTLLDSADTYPIIVEIKGGHTIWDGRTKPVWVTSNYSPEEVMASQPQVRMEALKRRFQIVEVRWRRLGQMKILDWRIEAEGSFKAPKQCWWEKRTEEEEDEGVGEDSIE
jgi:hypothetical protein